MKAAALKHRVIIFYAVAFAVAWASWFVMSRLYNGQQPTPIVYLFSTLGGLAPLIALALLDRLTGKEISLRGILSHIRPQSARGHARPPVLRDRSGVSESGRSHRASAGHALRACCRTPLLRARPGCGPPTSRIRPGKPAGFSALAGKAG